MLTEEAFERIEETILPCISMMLDTLIEASEHVAEGERRFLIGATSVVGTVTLLMGALFGLAQRDLKRLLAYSSIAHVGYMLLGAAILVLERLDRAVDRHVLVHCLDALANR